MAKKTKDKLLFLTGKLAESRLVRTVAGTGLDAKLSEIPATHFATVLEVAGAMISV